MTDNPLDPKPYREMMADERYVSRAEARSDRAYVFDPRWRYEQDESKYL